MPSTENDRRNRQSVDIQYPSVPKRPRTQDRNMRAAFPSRNANTSVFEESELPALEVSKGAGIETRNTDERDGIYESDSELNFEETVSPVEEVNSIDQDNNFDR